MKVEETRTRVKGVKVKWKWAIAQESCAGLPAGEGGVGGALVGDQGGLQVEEGEEGGEQGHHLLLLPQGAPRTEGAPQLISNLGVYFKVPDCDMVEKTTLIFLTPDP